MIIAPDESWHLSQAFVHRNKHAGTGLYVLQFPANLDLERGYVGVDMIVHIGKERVELSVLSMFRARSFAQLPDEIRGTNPYTIRVQVV